MTQRCGRSIFGHAIRDRLHLVRSEALELRRDTDCFYQRRRVLAFCIAVFSDDHSGI